MLKQVADGVLVHQSELIQNNSVVVQGRTGVLLIDPGITGSEMACLARDLRELGQPVVAGFSTHPDWDHALWSADLGDAPRYGTERGATFLRELLLKADWEEQVAEGLPPESRTTYRWTFSASSPVCLLKLRTFFGMDQRCGSSNIRRTPRVTPHC